MFITFASYYLYLCGTIEYFNMRRYLYILLFGITLTACSTSSKYRKQLKEVGTIIEENPDSAKILLDKIPASLLSQEGERALYYLLQTKADYKLHKHFSNDSTINYCVRYYKKTNQTMRLAIAYYYKGVINYEELNRKEYAVHCLKKAEKLSIVSDNEALKNKIFELFHHIYYNAHNYKLSLKYANLFLESSMKMGDPELISRAYKLLSNDSDKRRNDAYGYYANLLLEENAAITEKALTERKNMWLTIAVAALAVLLMAFLAVVYLSRKAKEYRGIIDKDIEQIYQAEQKIELLQSTGKDYEHEVKRLKEQIDRLRETTAMELGLGKNVYDMITGGEMIKDFTKSKEQALINYYAYTFSKQYHGLILPYRKLTLRLTTYLVMQQMGLDDKRICELLNITDSTVRNYRHRLRNPE